MSFGINITPFACITHRFVSSKRLTTYTSATSHKLRRAVAWNLNSPFCCWAISLIHHTRDNLQIKNPIDFWHFQISHRASAQSKSSPLLRGEPRCLWVLPPPIFFLLSLLCTGFPPHSGTLHLLPIFVFHMYFFPYLYSITHTILLLFPWL